MSGKQNPKFIHPTEREALPPTLLTQATDRLHALPAAANPDAQRPSSPRHPAEDEE
jgi:hypothetical protein